MSQATNGNPRFFASSTSRSPSSMHCTMNPSTSAVSTLHVAVARCAAEISDTPAPRSSQAEASPIMNSRLNGSLKK